FAIHNTIDRYGIEVHAYSLMPNHYHLLIRSRRGNLSPAMKHLGSVYTLEFNRRHKRDGTLFRGRFKSQLVKDDAYLLYLFAYIHLNPVKAGLASRIDGLHNWTSYRRLLEKDTEPRWLSMTGLKEVFGDAEKMKEMTLRLHRKSEPWPVWMNRDEGWFRWHMCPVQAKRVEIAPVTGEIDVQILLKDICEITGVALSRLKESVYGPSGNPERRFACWALFNGAFINQRQIAGLLDLTTTQVAQNLFRCRNGSEKLAKWKKSWLQRYPEKVSTVIT
ncbi:MAG: transposase, partial [Deltaproteobacteria bacterium]|nr:transposase [Deltaproteobacteria bacterium]